MTCTRLRSYVPPTPGASDAGTVAGGLTELSAAESLTADLGNRGVGMFEGCMCLTYGVA